MKKEDLNNKKKDLVTLLIKELTLGDSEGKSEPAREEIFEFSAFGPS